MRTGTALLIAALFVAGCDRQAAPATPPPHRPVASKEQHLAICRFEATKFSKQFLRNEQDFTYFSELGAFIGECMGARGYRIARDPLCAALHPLPERKPGGDTEKQALAMSMAIYSRYTEEDCYDEMPGAVHPDP